MLVLCLAVLAGLSATEPQRFLRVTVGDKDTLSLFLPTLAQVMDQRPPGSAQAKARLEELIANDGKIATETANEEKGGLQFTNPLRNGRHALDAFFDELYALEVLGEPLLIRAAHYGDSQIEGDRITHFLRSTLQKEFGGGGCGFVRLDNPVSHQYITRKPYGPWRVYDVFQKWSRKALYGINGVGLYFTPPGGGPNPVPVVVDSATGDTLPPPPPPPAGALTQAGVDVKVTGFWYSTLRLAYGMAETPCAISVIIDGDTVHQDSLRETAAVAFYDVPVPANTKNFRLHFAAQKSPVFYGLLFDGGKGIQVDNFALRGHGGSGLRRIPGGILTAQGNALNTRLVILQYGGNAVPMTEVYDWDFYIDEVTAIVRKFQRALPEASIVVMSVSDAAGKVDGTYQSYHTVKRIRDAQRAAAERTGVAFWDLYQAMGGQGSIINWVNHKPPYAAKDFAHFSYAGQRLVANMLAAELLQEYAAYKARRKRTDATTAGPAAPKPNPL